MKPIKPSCRILLVGIVLLAGCGEDEQTTLPLSSLATEQELVEPDGPTPTPTFRPTEVAPTPASLDREMEDSDAMREQREDLVTEFVEPVVGDERIVQALRAIPRHAFVPTRYLERAYGDHPLPIEDGQTISQPSLVAMMTEMLDLQAGDRVLEIGTGSGYQASILRELTDQVYTIEIIPNLAGISRRVLDELGYADIHTLRGDGYYGWWEYAPFDAIIVTAAPDHLPAPLVAQLNPDGGRMVIPIGPPGGYQSLWLVVRKGDEIDMQQMLDVAFVTFTREQNQVE
jgi:protein-L-isoaspartate(D-aspartate) O-methyltransferase